jgi:hypothetical protein
MRATAKIVKVRSAVMADGLAAVEAACAEALTDGVVLNILSRRRDPGPAATILTPDALNSCKLYLPASTVDRK